MDDYPANSDRSKLGETESEPKKVERVTTSDPIVRKKGLGRKFKDTFFGGDGRTAIQYVWFSVLIPAAKDALAEAGAQGIEKLIFGETRRQRGGPPSGPLGHVSYHRYSRPRQSEPPRQISQRARSQHDFDEIILPSRQEADEVVERMFDLVDRFDEATVADLYELVGIRSTHTDHKWGWTDVRGTGTIKVRDGYLISLPSPVPLSN